MTTKQAIKVLTKEYKFMPSPPIDKELDEAIYTAIMLLSKPAKRRAK